MRAYTQQFSGQAMKRQRRFATYVRAAPISWETPRLRRTLRYLQSHQRRRARLRRYFRGDGYRHSYPSLWRLPPVDLGILRRCSRNRGEPQGQDRDHSDERSLSQTLRFLQPIGRGNSKMKPQYLFRRCLVVLAVLALEFFPFRSVVKAQRP